MASPHLSTMRMAVAAADADQALRASGERLAAFEGNRAAQARESEVRPSMFGRSVDAQQDEMGQAVESRVVNLELTMGALGRGVQRLAATTAAAAG